MAHLGSGAGAGLRAVLAAGVLSLGVAACGGEKASSEPPEGTETAGGETAGSAPVDVVAGSPAPEGTMAGDAGEADAGDIGETVEGIPATMNEDAFLAAYQQIEGVVVRESGLMYRVLESGTGRSPTLDDRVRVAYRGTLMDGTLFDEAPESQPAEFSVGGLIAGWKEVLPLMKEGDRWEVVIPSSLAYGEKGAEGAIPPNSPLVFEMKLIAVL